MCCDVEVNVPVKRSEDIASHVSNGQNLFGETLRLVYCMQSNYITEAASPSHDFFFPLEFRVSASMHNMLTEASSRRSLTILCATRSGLQKIVIYSRPPPERRSTVDPDCLAFDTSHLDSINSYSKLRWTYSRETIKSHLDDLDGQWGLILPLFHWK